MAAVARRSSPVSQGTVIGIVAMSLLVSDLDHPYHGFLCVRLHNVVTVIKLLDATCVRHSAEAFGKHGGAILASVEPPTAEGAAAVDDVEGRLRALQIVRETFLLRGWSVEVVNTDTSSGGPAADHQ